MCTYNYNFCDIKANSGYPVCIANKIIRFLFLLFAMYVTYTAVATPVRMPHRHPNSIRMEEAPAFGLLNDWEG
jgi:hypothetical protein